MKTTIYWFTTDSDGGTQTQLFATEAQQQGAREEFIRECWVGNRDEHLPPGADLDDAWDKLTSQCGFMDSCNWGEEQVDTTEKPTMHLLQIHGRHSVDQELHDWGFNGPTIEDVIAMHVVYCSTYALYFVDDEAAKKAHELTACHSGTIMRSN